MIWELKMESKITAFDIISFVASVASLILAVGAIWLSVVFYRMSTAASNATTQAAGGIAASVERLEKLFDKLYSDTFSMMRDTVSEIRKHMWPAEASEQEKVVEEAEKKADDKISDLKQSVEEQVSSLLQHQRLTDDTMSELRNEMRHILERAIVSSRQVDLEAREETVREHILRTVRTFRRTRPKVTVDDIVERLRGLFPFERIVSEIEKLKDEEAIELRPPHVMPDSEVLLNSVVSERAAHDRSRRADALPRD
jgi:uncharacterized membrane protein